MIEFVTSNLCINSASFAFKVLIIDELHELNSPCSNLVLSSPGYESVPVGNQLYPVIGAEPGVPDAVGEYC